MAENQASDDAPEPVSNGGGLLGAIFSGVAKVWNAIAEDGYLAAAGRQGLSELAQALKAFPDSIQVHEYGTLFSPTQGEIASDRAEAVDRPLWPSEIAEANRIAPPENSNGRDLGNGQGHDGGYSM